MSYKILNFRNSFSNLRFDVFMDTVVSWQMPKYFYFMQFFVYICQIEMKEIETRNLKLNTALKKARQSTAEAWNKKDSTALWPVPEWKDLGVPPGATLCDKTWACAKAYPVTSSSRLASDLTSGVTGRGVGGYTNSSDLQWIFYIQKLGVSLIRRTRSAILKMWPSSTKWVVLSLLQCF